MPLILIVCQLSNNSRGKLYREIIKEQFEYTFIYLITYIKLICFVNKSYQQRLDTTLIKYISSFNSLWFHSIIYFKRKSKYSSSIRLYKFYFEQ